MAVRLRVSRSGVALSSAQPLHMVHTLCSAGDCLSAAHSCDLALHPDSQPCTQSRARPPPGRHSCVSFSWLQRLPWPSPRRTCGCSPAARKVTLLAQCAEGQHNAVQTCQAWASLFCPDTRAIKLRSWPLCLMYNDYARLQRHWDQQRPTLNPVAVGIKPCGCSPAPA